MVAVNNKDIRRRERGEARIERSLELLPAVRASGAECAVSAGGIADERVAARLLDAGYDALLVGTALLCGMPRTASIEEGEVVRGASAFHAVSGSVTAAARARSIGCRETDKVRATETVGHRARNPSISALRDRPRPVDGAMPEGVCPLSVDMPESIGQAPTYAPPRPRETVREGPEPTGVISYVLRGP